MVPPWRFLNFHLEHPKIFKIDEKKLFNFIRADLGDFIKFKGVLNGNSKIATVAPLVPT